MRCATCSVEFEVVGNPGRRKYCAACKHLARLETFRRHNKKRDREKTRAHEQRRRQTLARKEYQKAYLNGYSVNRRRASVRLRLDHRMGEMIRRGLQRGKEGRHWDDLVDFSLLEIMAHLERQFVKGMSWGNMGEWHIDHIVPLSSFDFRATEDEHFKAAWALTNLRPVWARENLSKHSLRTHLL